MAEVVAAEVAAAAEPGVNVAVAAGAAVNTQIWKGLYAGVLSLLVLLGLATQGWAQTSGDASGVIVRSTQIAGIPPLSFSLEASSTQRYALVVGNGEYDTVPDLPNAVNDARDVASLLRAGGYVVADYYDITKQEFEAALRRMLFEVEPGAELFFFYAGHGVQIGSQNYLLPSDTDIDSIYDVPFSTVSLSSLMSLASTRARSMVAVLDACRDNPFPGQQGVVYLDGTPASLKTGFTAQDTPINSLVVFSTSPGAVALDGVGENSPFTTALIKTAEASPTQPFNDMLKQIRREVYALTGQRQVPWESSSLIEPIYLSKGSDLVIEPSGTVTPTVTGAPMSIEATLDRSVSVRRQLMDASGQNSADVAILQRPQTGRLAVLDDGRSSVLPLAANTSIPTSNELVYRPFARQVRAVSLVSKAEVEDEFQISVNGAVHNVQMKMTVDPCDFQAGDHLDPDGVGITRFPNEIEPYAAIEACEAAIGQSPENGRFHYQLGRAFLALRQVDKAQAAYERAAELGHTRAIHGQGVIEVARYAETAGAQSGRAPDAALSYYLKGVELGDPYAYHSLGLQYLRHSKSDDEQREGFELLSRSLELGHTFSMNALGLYFLNEKADHYDPERGLRYWRESAARSDIYGYANMAYAFLEGIGGTTKDAKLAFELYQKASEGGHPNAPTSIGRMYNAGTAPGGSNAAKAVEWYDVGLERGDAWGGANGAWVIANRNPAGYTIFDAVSRAAKAAALRNPGPVQEARNFLSGLNGKALDGGAQKLMAELGVAIEVDGAFGGQSQAALDALGAQTGSKYPSDRVERVIALAKTYWERSKFRVDLY